MRMQHLCGTARALYRVFVKFEPTPLALHSIRAPPAAARPTRRLAAFPLLQTRPYSKKSSNQPTPKARPPQDEEIEAKEVQVVNDEGGLDDPVPLLDLLSSFDRKTYCLVQVSPPNKDLLPVCKIMSKKQLLEDRKAKAKPPKNPQTSRKKLELNWAIAPNDLNHRLRKLQEFLEAGRRVEILLAPKRKARQATSEEAEGTLRKIREAAESVKGAKEWKNMEGKLLGTATLHFEGAKEK